MQRQKYLEIYPSEVAARKISKHLDKMMEIKPRVYQKTLLRYKKLAYLLIECVSKIVRMLQSETLLSSSSSEFQELGSDFDIEQISELKASIDSLGDLVDKKPTTDSGKIAGETLRKYKEVFHQASASDFGYIEVNECAGLLDYWITRRFSGFNQNFKFQITQLPLWATFVVIAYGRYRSIGDTSKFVSDFKQWCDELDNDPSNCWVLPHNVFNMTRTINANNFTLDAMVIYDLLIKGCLYSLTESDVKYPLDPFMVAKLVKEYRPDLSHSVRTRFTRQAALIEQLNLHSTEDDVEEQI